MRLNKYISETGICSRREADQWIEAGRVTLNGAVAGLGMKVSPGDEVRVDGAPLGRKNEPVYIAFNKPIGITCTTETTVEDNIIDFIGHPERIFPVGRLDKDSEGLILLTNDGDIVNPILRAENEHEKEYLVRVNRPITDLALEMLARGVKIMGVVTKPCRAIRVGPDSFRLILTQGLNRQIRRMCSALGLRVQQLRRIRIMHLDLGTLKPGEWRALSAAEIDGLNAPGATRREAPPPATRPSNAAPSTPASPAPAPATRASERNPRPDWSNKSARTGRPRSSTRR